MISMFNLKKCTSSAVLLSATLGLSSCSQPLCEVDEKDPRCNPVYYAADTKVITVSCPQGVLDSRTDGALTIAVEFRAPGDLPTTQTPPRKLAPLATGTPKVYLQTDREEVLIAPENVLTSPDQQGLNVIVKAGQLGIGELKVRVVVSEGTGLQATASAVCAVTRSLRFGAANEVAQMRSPRGPAITGFSGVQIGTVLGTSGRLLLGEQFLGGTGVDQRWAELYGTASGSVVRDTSNPTWVMTIQKQLQESGSALFAVTRDALLIYDIYMGGPAKDLSLFVLNPPSSTRASNLASGTPPIGTDRTSLAAASDDQLMLLGGPGRVSWFRVVPTAGPKFVTSLGDAAVTGTPVLAARAERVGIPKIAYGPYFGVAWGTDGKATLLRANVQTLDLSAESLDEKAQQSFKTSLNSEQVVAAALADLNGDGLEDLLVATSGSRFLWAPQQLDNRFAAVSELNVKPGGIVTSLSVGDLNGDGVADLAAIASQRAFVYFGSAM